MKGKIVCSKAGSDKDSFLVIVETKKDRLLVADGKRYKLSSPKLKNPKHLAFTDKSLNLEEITTDKGLRKAIAIFRNNNQ